MVEVNRLHTGELAHEFGALNTLLLVVLIGLCTFVAYLVKRYRYYYLPESAAAMLIGFIVGLCAKLFYPSQQELEFLSFQSEIFFFLLLPPIILEAGYTMSQQRFFDNFGPIVLFAVFGTVIMTFGTAFIVYGVANLGLINIDTSSPLEALLFGALISSVDPVATLSIMGSADLGCNPLLYTLVFGESVLNDAVCIGLFNTFMKSYVSGEAFTRWTIFNAMIDFAGVSLLSVFVGVAVGLGCAYMCKHTDMRDYPEFEISLLLLYAYASYAVAEVLHLSGIMSLFFCGIIMKHYNCNNLSHTSEVTTEYIFKSFARLAEFFVFIYMGMCFFTGQFDRWSIIFIVVSVLACLIARAVSVYSICWIVNLRRPNLLIPRNMQLVIWFCGLRGAMAFALSQTMPGKHRDLYVSTTLSVCVLTTVVGGGLTEPLLSWAGMRTTHDENYDPDDGLLDGREDGEFGLRDDEEEEVREPRKRVHEGNKGHEMLKRQDKENFEENYRRQSMDNFDASNVQSIWAKLDQKYLKPMFTKSTKTSPRPSSGHH